MKGCEELTTARKKEIIEACAKLYKIMSFKEITIKEIANFTSFTRPSIYNYFQTKEEIFLALLGQEYELWVADLKKLNALEKPLSKRELAEGFAHTLEKRTRLLKLLSTNMNDMEQNSRLENLIEFKMAYRASLEAVQDCLRHYCPDMTEDEQQEFLYSFFLLVYAIYPYTFATEKQLEAMRRAGIQYRSRSIYEVVYNGTKRLLGV